VRDGDDDLIAELRALSDRLAVPAPAGQWTAVRARLTRPGPRRRRVRLILATVVAAAVGTVAAVAPARAAVVHTIGGLLRVAGIEIRTDAAPTVPPSPAGPLPSVRPVALAEARRVAPFTITVPAALGAPEQVLLADPDPGGAPRIVTLVYRGGTVRLDEFDGALSTAFAKTAPDARWVEIGTGYGVWLPGPHTVTYVGRDGVERTATARLAGPTLIWEAATVGYRLEGLPAEAEAVGVAQSLR